MCISDVKEEGGLATLKELREKFGEDKVSFKIESNKVVLFFSEMFLSSRNKNTECS